jgi:hypothetical protein
MAMKQMWLNTPPGDGTFFQYYPRKDPEKTNYDDANIQLITGNASLTQGFPVIGHQTPIDKIPANLRVLITLLQKNGVSGLDDTIIKGYKLKDL